MKAVIKVLDLFAFLMFGTLFGCLILGTMAVSYGMPKRPGGALRRNKLSFAVFDLISNKYGSMLEDALLGGYFGRHDYIYLDFNNRNDRFENIAGNIRFYSIAAHPDSAIYRAGFTKVNALIQEAKMLCRAFSIALIDGVDIVKAHDPHLLGLNGLVIAKAFRASCVLHLNSDFDMKYIGTGKVSQPVAVSRPVERMFESSVMGGYDLIMADREFYGKSRSFPRKSLPKYRPFGVRVDMAHYAEPGARRDLKPDLGVEGRPVVLFVGRLHPVKYPEDAIRAFAMIKRRVSNACMLVVGTGVLREELERTAEEEGVSGSVIFLGRKGYGELVDILYTADVLLAPHGGMTLVEAALASTPAVAYDFDWHSEFIRDGETGYIVPFRDHRGMADKAVRILTDDPLRQGMGSRCRALALSSCSREISIRREKSVYGELVGR